MSSLNNKGFIRSQDMSDHKSCKIDYYTYSLLENPDDIKVCVNVQFSNLQNQYIKSIGIDEVFKDEKKAIAHALNTAKTYIEEHIGDDNIS